jgi:hypothetical protein
VSEPFDRETVLLLGRLEGKVDSLLAQTAQVHSRVEKVEIRVTGLETWRDSLAGVADRVEGLESWKTKIVGAFALMTAAGGGIIAFKDEILKILLN